MKVTRFKIHLIPEKMHLIVFILQLMKQGFRKVACSLVCIEKQPHIVRTSQRGAVQIRQFFIIAINADQLHGYISFRYSISISGIY